MSHTLGIQPNDTVAVIPVTEQFQSIVGVLPEGVKFEDISAAPLDVLIFFTTKKAELGNECMLLRQSIAPNGTLWVIWPKKSMGVPTDLDEQFIRQIGLANGLVGKKVVTVDPTWSGLKLVHSTKDH